MTVRAFIIGLLGAASICSVVYFNDYVLRQTPLISHYLPVSVFGGLLLFVIAVNPLLRRIREGLPLTGAELAVVVGCTLVACGIPSSGLMRNFAATLMLPHKFIKTETGWAEADLLRHAPDRLLADPDAEGGEALDGMLQGMGLGNESVTLADIPWAGWVDTLWFWIPLILCLYAALLGLGLVVHQQWSRHEFLPYPIVQVIQNFLPEWVDGRRRQNRLFTNRLFWIGLAFVFLFHLNNYLYHWFPTLIQIPREVPFMQLTYKLPQAFHGQQGFMALNIKFFFSAIAIAYLLPKEISLSVGLGPILFAFVNGLFIAYGVNLQAGGIYAPSTFVQVGAYFGIALMVIYTGRHFYWTALSGALGHKTNRAAVPGFTVWGVRIFLVSTLGFVLLLSSLGLDWQLSVFFTICLLLTFLALSRIVAETGVFALQIMWFPGALLVGFLGVQAVGPGAFLILSVATMVIMADPRENVMPFLVNALRLGDMRSVGAAKSSPVLGLAILVALGVALPVSMFWIYQGGAQNIDGWAASQAGKLPLDHTLQVQQRLFTQGALESSEAISGFQRFLEMSPDSAVLGAFFAGMGLVILFSFCRLRFNNWPLHPVMFAVIMGWPTILMAGSFLIGWFSKVLTTKYGGEKGFRSVKPLMLGLLGGEILAGFTIFLIGMIVYFLTGKLPTIDYSVMPG